MPKALASLTRQHTPRKQSSKKSAESPKISLPLQRFRPYDLERTY